MVSTLALSSAHTPAAPAALPATLTFDTTASVLAGISYGIEAVDSRPTFLGDRRATQVQAGMRTVSYSCPSIDGTTQDARITFNFVGGGAYRLVCGSGKGAIIRADDC